MRIFLSSTYEDLREHRAAVLEQLRRMEEDGAGMEYFAATAAEPVEASLRQLSRSSVYVGLIGHRFGSRSPGTERSMTQCEYEAALELWERGSMEILLYLADRNVALPVSLIESDSLREKQEEFRARLRAAHTCQTFSSKTDLVARLAADLYTLAKAQGSRGDEGPRIFDRDGWPIIRDRFDNSADDRLSRVQRFLGFLASSFSQLFRIDPAQLDIHPFFKEVREQLKQLIPGVSLNDEGGILRRTGVRHVILRCETAVLLVTSLKEGELFRLGEQIGTGAASDLIRNTIEDRELIPASAEAFVSLWNYWDRTGGWGNIQLVETGESAQPVWRLKIENNFLMIPDNLTETHRLCSFWCGYIKGVLNEALPRITEVMHSRLPQKVRRLVALPPYHRVVRVVHEEDDSLTEDHFQVHFRRERFSDALQALSNCQNLIREGVFEGAMARCRVAVRSVRDELGAGFDERLGDLELNATTMETVRRMLNPGEATPASEETASAWFSAANQFIQRLSATAPDA